MHQGRRLANNSCLGINTQIPAAFWVIAPCYGCITALLPEQSHSAPSATGPSTQRPLPFCVTGAASHIGNKFGQMGVDLLREFHVAPVLRRVWCCGSCECHRSHCDRGDDKAHSKPFLAAMAVATTSQDGSQPPSGATLEGLGRTSLFCVRGLP
jgi:hypothetical protein